MNEDKKTFLLELIGKLEEQIGEMSLKLEDDSRIKDENWDKYEQSINGLNQLLNDLKENVYFT